MTLMQIVAIVSSVLATTLARVPKWGFFLSVPVWVIFAWAWDMGHK